MTEPGSLRLIAEQLADAVAPLDRAFRDVAAFRTLMRRLGWTVQDLPPAYVAVADGAAATVAAVEALAEDADLPAILDVISKVGSVYRSLDGLAAAPAGVDAASFLAEIGRGVFEHVLAEYLALNRPGLHSTLEAAGVIAFEDVAPAAGRPGYVRTRFEWESIPEIFTDPDAIAASVYGWGTSTLDFAKLAEILTEMFVGLGLAASVDRIGSDLSEGFQSQSTTGEPETPIRRGVTVPLFDWPIAGVPADVGIAINELPAEGTALPGLIVRPVVPVGIDTGIDLGDGWSFALRAGTDLADELGIVLRPDEITVRYPFAPGREFPGGGFGFSFDYASAVPTLLFGDPEATRVEFTGGSLSVDIDLIGGELDLTAGVVPTGLTFVLSTGALDGFLANAIGLDNASIELPFALSWSKRTGLDFTGGLGFEISLYPHIDLGVVRFDRVDLALRLDPDGEEGPEIDLRVTASISGALGPFAYIVDRLGVELPIVLRDGNAGPFEIGFGPVWPTGLGMTLDAGAVTGGGYISFDPELGRYAGILELSMFDISVSAIGILDTKDSSGRPLPPPGFSLLISIAAEFPPIQLGYGFTLNGVGGLAAVHRRLDTDAFLAGVREGALDSVLFPNDCVAEASAIISDLSTIFPVAMDRYVFGPMAILGWGTPTLVRAELGILLEIPDPLVLALVGQGSVAVPSEEAAIISLHIDVVGILDLGMSLIAIDASLRDSYVLQFALAGDMALRLSWSETSNFALAVGGFNPQFDAPADFPTLRRVSITLGLGDNPRISLESYFAITANSLQIGARAELYAEALGFSVEGWVGFDALLIFQPLSFRFDFSAGMTLYRGSSRIAGITVDGHLTGPSPFHAWGSGCVTVLFKDIRVPFDETFGERKDSELPATDPWPLLEAAIQRIDNWHAELDDDVESVVTLLAPADAPEMLLLHPMGSATLRQRVLPFNRLLERFGQHELIGPDRYDITGVRIGTAAAGDWDTVEEDFAPGDFETLGESEKLSRDSFEPMDAGISIGDDVVDSPLHAIKVATLEYETRIIDAPWRIRLLPLFVLGRGLQLLTVLRGAKAFSPLFQSGATKFATVPSRAATVTLSAETYTIATTDTLEPKPEIANEVTRGAAVRALKASPDRSRLQISPMHDLGAAA